MPDSSEKLTSVRPWSGLLAVARSTSSSVNSTDVSISGSSTGRLTTEVESAGDHEGISDVVLASRMTTCTFGCAACTARRSWGTSQRAVVPITPRRASPATSWPIEAASAVRRPARAGSAGPAPRRHPPA